MNTEYIERLRSEYKENHIKNQIREELISECNIEKRDIKGYHGREILELLQNADDAYQKSLDSNHIPDCELNVEIKYEKDFLSISNTGTFFDEDGIKAIVQGNNSPKKGRYIGNKGTGFRSILNWADEVRIYSGEFAIEFSKKIASDFFDSIKDTPQVRKQLKKYPSLYVPMLAVPQNIEHTRSKDRTTIEILLDENKLNDDYSVYKQLDSIDLRILLFLPNITRITINTEDSNIIYERLFSERIKSKSGIWNKKVELIKRVNGNVVCSESFILFRKEIPYMIKEDDTMKDVQFAIAVPCQNDVNIKHLYSYFPLLETDSPFNCILHASYILSDHRNSIVFNDENKCIIKKQLEFLIEVAADLLSANCFETVYRILLPKHYSLFQNEIFTSTFSNFNIKDCYIQMLSGLRMFKTVSDRLISINEKPKIIECKFPRVFRNKSFENLLKYSDDKNQLQLINLLCKNLNINLSYRPDALCKAINSVSNIWNINDQVDVFIWWNQQKYYDLLPKLLKTQRNKWLKCKDECYFLEGDFDSVKFPAWVKLKTLEEAYQKSLLLKTKGIAGVKENLNKGENGRKISVARFICQENYFKTIVFKYRDRSNIIPAINASVSTTSRAIQFVRWLWIHYGKNKESEKTFSSDYSKYPLKFPSGQKVVNSNNLYFGSVYGNSLAKHLFSDDYYELPDAVVFGIDEKDVENFKCFMRKFGVLDYPRIELQFITSPLNSYDSLMKKEIFDSGVYEGRATDYVEYCKYRLPYIENLTDILSSLSTKDIVLWIIRDLELSNSLAYGYYTSDAEVTYHGNNQWSGTEWRYEKSIRNYILYVFNEIKWVEIDNVRYSPKQVLNGFDSKSNQKFKNLLPVITSQIVEDIARTLGVKYDIVTSVLSKFSFANKVTDLSSNDFYGLMLKLPELGSNGFELSKVIYRIIEQADFVKEFDDSENKNKFFDQGSVLVKYKGVLLYHLAKESYLPSTKIINKKSFPIIEKAQRTNNANFVRLFKCKEYKDEDLIVSGSEVLSCLNKRFQIYFKDFIKYARAYSERNENIAKYINRLRVSIVSSIDIVQNKETVSIVDNYSLIRDSVTNWYIVINDNKFDINFISENIENIFANIVNTPGFEESKIGELFRSSSNADREFLIKKEFGSLEVVDDSSYGNDIRRNFTEVLNVLEISCNIDDYGIDFNNFDSINNSPFLIDLFKNNNIDIDEFQSAGFVYPIDVRKYYKVSLKEFIQKEKQHFKDFIFYKALQNLSLQKSFVETLIRFENFSDKIEYENSVMYDPIDKLIEEFGDWRSDNYNVSASETYRTNYERMNPDDLYGEEISNDTDALRMIYFGLDSEFKLWLELQTTDNVSIYTNKCNDPYSDFRSTIPQEKELVFRECTPVPEYNGDGTNPHGEFSHRMRNRKDASLKRIGNIGELLVYNLLCSLYGKDNVEPHSEAFVELGIIKHGEAVSGDYDISYTDKDKKLHYVEVKTGERNMFLMSLGEFKFAKENSSNYHVYYVYDINTASPQYNILPLEFWNDKHYRKTEIIEKIEFDF